MASVLSNAYSGVVVEKLLLRRPLARQRERERAHQAIASMEDGSGTSVSALDSTDNTGTGPNAPSTTGTNATNALNQTPSTVPVKSNSSIENGPPTGPAPVADQSTSSRADSEVEAGNSQSNEGLSEDGDTADQVQEDVDADVEVVEEEQAQSQPPHRQAVDSTHMVKYWVFYLRGVDVLDGYISHLNFDRVHGLKSGTLTSGWHHECIPDCKGE